MFAAFDMGSCMHNSVCVLLWWLWLLSCHTSTCLFAPQNLSAAEASEGHQHVGTACVVGHVVASSALTQTAVSSRQPFDHFFRLFVSLWAVRCTVLHKERG